MKLLKSMVATVLAIGMLSTTPAHSRELREIYSECGLGAMIFSGGSDNDEILAIISNITWDWGTSALLSNAITPENCSGGDAQTAAFIMQTYPSIERDLAIGEGEFLAAMLNFRGCETAVHTALITDLRADMAEGIAANGAGDAELLFNSLQNRVQTSYSSSCMI